MRDTTLDGSTSGSKQKTRSSGVSGKGFIRHARFGKKRSQSMPVEHVAGVSGGDSSALKDSSRSSQESKSEGNHRTRQRVSLEFLRRSTPPLMQRRDSISGDSKEGSHTTEESGEVPHSSSDEGSRRRPSTIYEKNESKEETDNDEKIESSVMVRTQIIPRASSPQQNRKSNMIEAIDLHIPSALARQETPHYSCATAILQLSYLEQMCGSQYPSNNNMRIPQLPDDPTVQESIECIFASQLEEGLNLLDDEFPTDDNGGKPEGLISPAFLLQSRQNRSDRNNMSAGYVSHTGKKRYQQASLAYVATIDDAPVAEDDKTFMSCDDAIPCACESTSLPSLNPKDWPQAPLLLRPTPGSGTSIKGVRFANSKEYFWEPTSQRSWSQCLAEKWGVPVPCHSRPRTGCCPKCAVLPINNGNEANGESLFIDFETELFEGTLMLRLRFTEGTTKEAYNDGKGYFAGMHRRYQAVVRGRFKKSIPFTELVTGFQLQRPCGRLPAKWILRGGLKVLSFFAPQLDAKFEGGSPYSLAPLGSTPQAIRLETAEKESLENLIEEPTQASSTLLGEKSLASSSLQRARARKKAFDRLYVQKSSEPKTDLSKFYTFEFLQHLFNFQDFSIELGSMLGSVQLDDVFDGQPLQFMAAHGDKPLWSFDIWHECLWETAKKHDKGFKNRL
jgi:hypothetical protein